MSEIESKVMVCAVGDGGGGSERTSERTSRRDDAKGGRGGLGRGLGGRVGKGLREKEFRQVWDRTRVNA